MLSETADGRLRERRSQPRRVDPVMARHTGKVVKNDLFCSRVENLQSLCGRVRQEENHLRIEVANVRVAHEQGLAVLPGHVSNATLVDAGAVLISRVLEKILEAAEELPPRGIHLRPFT